MTRKKKIRYVAWSGCVIVTLDSRCHLTCSRMNANKNVLNSLHTHSASARCYGSCRCTDGYLAISYARAIMLLVHRLFMKKLRNRARVIYFVYLWCIFFFLLMLVLFSMVSVWKCSWQCLKYWIQNWNSSLRDPISIEKFWKLVN